jgi:multiple sugar transport system permease protein
MDQVTAVRPNVASRGLRAATPYLFLFPALLFVAIFLLYPFARSAYLSFTDFKGIGDPQWVGIDNYRNLAKDPVLSRTLTNTMYWVIGTLILPVGLGRC